MSRRKKKQLYILLEGTMRRVTAIYVKDARFQKYGFLVFQRKPKPECKKIGKNKDLNNEV